MRSKGSAASLALIYQGQVLMIFRRDESWAFPGGRLLEGEKSLQGALREFSEEIGVAPPPHRILTALTGYTGTGRRHTLWVAEALEPIEEMHPSEREVLKVAWAKPKEAITWNNLHFGVRDDLMVIHYLPSREQ